MNKAPEEPQVRQAMSGLPSPGSRLGADEGIDGRVPHRHRRRFGLRHGLSDTEKGLRHKNLDGAFDGSFAGTARQRTEVYVKPWYLRSQYFTEGWTDTSIWRAAMVELFATAFQLYMSGQLGITLINYKIVQIAAYVGIYNSLLLAVFIYATAPASGGHMNPLITFASMICGLCPVSRGVLYMLAQTTGGALAGGVLLGSWGKDRAVSHMGGGVFFDPAIISPGQVLLTEIMSSAAMVFLAIGVGLDPRQQLVFGPQLAPLLVGISMGLVTSSTTGVAPGYAGASINPARAFGLAVARGSFDYQWIWWVGPALGAMVVAILYEIAPPSHAQEADENAHLR